MKKQYRVFAGINFKLEKPFKTRYLMCLGHSGPHPYSNPDGEPQMILEPHT